VVALLRAAGEPTRLRLLLLLAETDLTVSGLTEILGQSQPRISRHLKLLTEAGLLERYQEGAWAYYRLTDQGLGNRLVQAFKTVIVSNDLDVARDRERLGDLREKRSLEAASYFSRNASEWDRIRSLHVDEANVESAMLDMVGNDEPVEAMLDLGTGTGRILELFSDRYGRAVGVDASRDMLSLARTRLDEAALPRVQTRQGDLLTLSVPEASFDLVTIHQVLHFLDEPALAIREAAKAMKPSGRLLIVDFAPHQLEFLRQEHAHRRMGFSKEQMAEWFMTAQLELEAVRDLPSKQNGQTEDTLTVSLWLARK